MKITRTNQHVNIVMSQAEWRLMGKRAGWGESALPEDIDPVLLPEDEKPELSHKDTFLNADPTNIEDMPIESGVPDSTGDRLEALDTGIGSEDGLGLPEAGGETGGGWETIPTGIGEYVMSSDSAGGLEQEVYYDGKQLFVGDKPISLDEIKSQQPDVRFKLKVVDEPNEEIQREGWGGSAGDLDMTNVPF